MKESRKGPNRLRVDPERSAPRIDPYPCAAFSVPLLAADAVLVRIEPVDVGTDHAHRSADVGGPVPLATRAVDVARDGNAGAAVVRAAAGARPSGRRRALRRLGDRRPGVAVRAGLTFGVTEAVGPTGPGTLRRAPDP